MPSMKIKKTILDKNKQCLYAVKNLTIRHCEPKAWQTSVMLPSIGKITLDHHKILQQIRIV